MKILHVIGSLDGRTGGPASWVMGYCKSLVKKGIDTSIYTLDLRMGKKAGESESFSRVDEGVKIRYFRYKGPQSYLYSPDLRDALADTVGDFDLAHINGIWIYPVLASSRYCSRFRVPYIVNTHAGLLPYALSYKSRTRLLKLAYGSLVERRVLNSASAVHCATNQEMIALRSFKVRSPAFVVPNGVDFVGHTELKSSKAIFANKYPELAGKKLILYMGRIAAIKGIDRLIEAFQYVHNEMPQVHLVIAGPDNEGYARQVRQWLLQRNLIDSVTFTGFLSGQEKLSAFANADVFCLCSYQETHSLVLNEAMMCGIPIVVTRSASIDEKIEKKQAGIVVDGSPDDISAAVLRLLADQNLRTRLGGKWAQVCMQSFNLGHSHRSISQAIRGDIKTLILPDTDKQIPSRLIDTHFSKDLCCLS